MHTEIVGHSFFSVGHLIASHSVRVKSRVYTMTEVIQGFSVGAMWAFWTEFLTVQNVPQIARTLIALRSPAAHRVPQSL